MQEENFRKDAVIISWSKIVHEKLQDKSLEYCLECKDNNGDNHRDDCYRGNNLKFILHHFPNKSKGCTINMQLLDVFRVLYGKESIRRAIDDVHRGFPVQSW